jgi:hypothetical protein
MDTYPNSTFAHMPLRKINNFPIKQFITRHVLYTLLKKKIKNQEKKI